MLVVPRPNANRPEVVVSFLLSLSRLIDRITERIGHALYWLILVTVLISAANAVVRKAFNYSSNSYLEAQWYLFSAVFLGAAGYTLLRNEHVRIDVISSRLSRKAQTWIDIFGIIFFLLPMAILIGWLGWPVFVDSYVRNEVSTNAGGLIIWPARLLVPVGFFLLAVQGISELIKRVAFLMGLAPDPLEKHYVKTLEEQLAEDILRARGEESLAAEIAAQAPKPDGDRR
jgi:TRAP-type mannitol/chloroaromatic compound transport system permease small subunit